jgi:hypothetical protein
MGIDPTKIMERLRFRSHYGFLWQANIVFLHCAALIRFRAALLRGTEA